MLVFSFKSSSSKQRFKILLILSTVLVCPFDAVLGAAQPPGPIDPTGKAREAAIAELKALPNHTRPFGIADPSALVGATLGEPFLYYWADSTFFEFETARDQAILNYITNCYVSFPVILEDRILGTINVIEENSHYVFGSRLVGSDFCSQMKQVSQIANLANGKRLSFLATGISGNFFIIEDGDSIYQMAAADERTNRIAGVKQAKNEPPAFFSVDRFAQPMKHEIGAFRKRVNSPENVFRIETPTDEPEDRR